MGVTLRGDQSHDGSKQGNTFLKSLEITLDPEYVFPIFSNVQRNVTLSKPSVLTLFQESLICQQLKRKNEKNRDTPGKERSEH